MAPNTPRETYLHKSMSQIPRLLTLLDRKSFSDTYGCFHRDYWLYKTCDFPDAVRQFGMLSLALVYSHPFPNNPYYQNERILHWCIASLLFWCKIQHRDGSFDEFYPFERGWVGPTAFTTYAAAEAYLRIQDKLSADQKNTIETAIRKAAEFIAKGEREKDDLANHHAMACLAIWKANLILNQESLRHSYEEQWRIFMQYHQIDEGWSTEYDGPDPGYLSATISFLAKIYKDNQDEQILNVADKSVAFCSHFAYPNGFYAGSTGSRNTLHFYPHGFEVLSKEIPLAGAVAEHMLQALSEDKLVPPEIMSDRYVFYRIPEFLESYIDYGVNNRHKERLPFQKESYYHYFKKAGIWASKNENHYWIANLAKGGVLKVFDCKSGKLIYNDCGILAKGKKGGVLTSQWIDPSYQIVADLEGWRITGCLNQVASGKVFNPAKLVMFRIFLILFGWHPVLAHALKGWIRKILILGSKRSKARFVRELRRENNRWQFVNRIDLTHMKIQFRHLAIGGEFFVRYVPQSQFFQTQELAIRQYILSDSEIRELNKTRLFERFQNWTFNQEKYSAEN